MVRGDNLYHVIVKKANDMNAIFSISTEQGQLIYAATYAASFLLLLVLFLYEGYRQKYALSTWMMMGVLVCTFVIVGSKVGTFNMAEWRTLLFDWQLPASEGKTALGALAGGVLGVLLAKKLFQFKPSLLDGFAFAMPAAMMLQRVGCLFAGCCYGLPSELPWGIQYVGDFNVCEAHASAGLVPYSDGHSAVIHPVQVYLIFGYLLTIVVLLRYRHRLRAANSLGLLSLAIGLSIRFVTEFFRDPATNHQLGEVFFGLKSVQWAILSVVIIAAAFLYWNEIKVPYPAKAIEPPKANFKREWVGLFLLAALVWLFSGLLTGVETLVMNAMLGGAFAGLVVHRIKKHATPRLRWSVVSLVMLAMLVMGQTYDDNSSKDDEILPFRKLEIAHSRGNPNIAFVEEITKSTGDCSSETTQKNIKIPSFATLGAQFTSYSKNARMIGFGFVATPYLRNGETIKPFYLNFLAGQDFKNFGIKAGAHFGDIKMLGAYKRRFGSDITTQKMEIPFMPILEFRFGNYDLAYFDFGMADDLPYGVLTSRFHGGVGVGKRLFGLKNEFNLNCGLFDNVDELGMYVNAGIGLGSHLVLSPQARFGPGNFNTYGMKIGYKFYGVGK